MTTFANRVCNYPVVGDTCKAAAHAYNWVKDTKSVGPLVQTAENKALAVMKSFIDTELAQKLDDIACAQVLDRAEAVCSHIKTKSTDSIILPTANRALNIVERCADLCLPKDEDPNYATGNATHTERLSRLQYRASKQAFALMDAAVENANALLASLVAYGSSINEVVSKATLKNTLAQIVALYEFAHSTAKAISLPIAARFIGIVLEQVQKLNAQLKESNKVNWVDLKQVVDALEYLKSALNGQQDSPEIELQPISSHNSLLSRLRDFTQKQKSKFGLIHQLRTKKANSKTESVLSGQCESKEKSK